MSFWDILRVLVVGYPIGPEMINSNYPAFLQQTGGLCLTLIVTVLSLIISIPFALVLAYCRTDTPQTTKKLPWGERANRLIIHWTATVALETLRGIPVMILVLLAFYLPYRLFEIRIPPVILAIAAFSLYAGVYLSEMFRSGFRAVDTAWTDVARVLGLSPMQILFRIKLPIALRTMLPDLLGLVITIFKDTSVLVVVAVPELTYSARQIQVAQPVNFALILGLILFIYWSLATAGSVLCHKLESASDRPYIA